ncbi:hypothetical protein V7056_10730 [Bacillus sp. JJ664]
MQETMVNANKDGQDGVAKYLTKEGHYVEVRYNDKMKRIEFYRNNGYLGSTPSNVRKEGYARVIKKERLFKGYHFTFEFYEGLTEEESGKREKLYFVEEKKKKNEIRKEIQKEKKSLDERYKIANLPYQNIKNIQPVNGHANDVISINKTPNEFLRDEQALIDFLTNQDLKNIPSVDAIDALANEVIILNKTPENYNKIIENGWKLTELLTSKIKIRVDVKEISSIIVSAHIDHNDINKAIEWLDEMSKCGYEFPYITKKLMGINKLQNGHHLENITDNRTLNSIASLYKELKAYNKAKSVLVRALELQPNNRYSLAQLGGIYRKLQMHSEGIIQYEKSLKIQENKHALNGLGGIYRDITDYDNALKYYKSALELNESDMVAHTGIGAVYIDLKEYENANYHFEIAGINTIKYLENEYIMFMKENSIEKAFECLEQILSIDPNNTRAKNELDYINEQNNKNEKKLSEI